MSLNLNQYTILLVTTIQQFFGSLTMKWMLILFIAFYSKFAQSEVKKEVLIWELQNSPPYVILDGNLKGQGMQDQIHTLIRDELKKHFIIDEREIPFTRRMRFFQDKRDICTGNVRKTPERLEVAHFSPISLILMPVSIFGKKGILGPTDTSFSINKLMAENKFIIGLSQDRSYGPDLDPIIKKGLKEHPTSFFKRPGG